MPPRAGTSTPTTRPLPRCPETLAVGAAVVTARLDNPHPNNPPGRRGIVAEVRVKTWPARQGEARPRQPPRAFVTIRIRPAEQRWPGERIWKWADELDLVVG